MLEKTCSGKGANQRQKNRSAAPPAYSSDTPDTHNQSRSDNRPDIDSPNVEKNKVASKMKTFDFLKRQNRGPAGIQPKWKNVSDPLKPQPNRSYDDSLFIIEIYLKSWNPFTMFLTVI